MPGDRLGPWNRRIGGRMGPTVELPAGCYSDDTQLRLAVGRCIRGTGRFDIEAFSKIELPVFLSYELGAGRGTKSAAHALSRRSTRWFSNFFDSRGTRYVDGGGNGAAMRIQPHVWAAPNAKPESYLVSVLRDAIATHGHARGILGAALHALALSTTLHQGSVPEPDRWAGMVGYLRRVSDMVLSDDTLRERWLPVWEDAARTSFAQAVAATVGELEEQISVAHQAARVFDGTEPERLYERLAKNLGGLDPKTRGSGTISAVLALWLAWTFRDQPMMAVRLPAELVGSDTDTVATMAGALIGVVAAEEPPEPLMDRELIIAEAQRLETLRLGQSADNFPHPDPLRWQPPASLSDALGETPEGPAMAGLGSVQAVGDLLGGQGRNAGIWQWVVTEFGQHMLVKRRAELPLLPETSHARARAPIAAPPRETKHTGGVSDALDLPDDPEAGVRMLVKRGFDLQLTARLLRHYGSRSATEAAVFATLYSERLRDHANNGRTNGGGTG